MRSPLLWLAVLCVLGNRLVAADEAQRPVRVEQNEGEAPAAPRDDFKIFDGQPTRLYFTGNPHHPTFGREKLAKLFDRYFDGQSPIVVDGLADARKDPITQKPIRPAKIPELIRFLEPVFAARAKQPEPRERLVVLNYVIVEQPRVKAPADWIKLGADELQQYGEDALRRGAQRMFFSEMVQPNHIQAGQAGNKFRRAGLQVFDELTSRKLPGIARGPQLQTLMEQHPHLFRDDRLLLRRRARLYRPRVVRDTAQARWPRCAGLVPRRNEVAVQARVALSHILRESTSSAPTIAACQQRCLIRDSGNATRPDRPLKP